MFKRLSKLRSGQAELRMAAIREITLELGLRAAEFIIPLLHDPEPAVRAYTATALGELRPPVALEPLLAALPDRSPDVRAAVVSALGQYHDHRIVPAFHQLLPDLAPPVIQALADAVKSLRPAERRKFEACLHHADTALRKGLVSLLIQIGDADAARLLNRVLEDPEPAIREAAANGLRQLGWNSSPHFQLILQTIGTPRWREVAGLGESAVEPLLICLTDRASAVRLTAAGTLGKIGDPRAVGPLGNALLDEDGDIRRTAACSLGLIGHPDALEALADSLRDRAPLVRAAAAEALGKIGDARAVDHLLPCLADDDRNVRWAAIEALGRIKEARTAPALLATLDDPAVAEAAINALLEILQRSGEWLSASELEQIAQLPRAIPSRLPGHSQSRRNRTDCLPLIHLARQELARRREKDTISS